VARTMEQGLTLACLRANGDLKTANEERDEDAGEAGNEDELATVSRATDALNARVSSSSSRGLALWVTRSDSKGKARSALTPCTHYFLFETELSPTFSYVLHAVANLTVHRSTLRASQVSLLNASLFFLRLRSMLRTSQISNTSLD
jgi:hypothetical protein